jgi:acyl-ACP thioesterase
LPPDERRSVTRDRVVTITRHIGLADVRPDGRARLDALARIAQDVADTDASSAPNADEMGVWILRRLAMTIAHTPRLRAEVSASTWCSGIGPRWAERSTTLQVGEVGCAAMTGIWVHVDRERGAPAPLPKAFDAVWGASAQGRKVSARLRHPSPPADARRSRWILRATDLDVLGHVNNAAYWAPMEEELARRGVERVTTAEIEFRAGLDRDDDVEFLVSDRDGGLMCWLTVDNDVRASMLVGCAQ